MVRRFLVWWHRMWLVRGLDIYHDDAYMASLTVYQRLDIQAAISDHKRKLDALEDSDG